MKIRTKKDVEELNDTIKTELGLELEEYKNEEVAADIVDMILFPKYFLKSIIRACFVTLLLFILGFFLIDLVHVEFLIYLIVGFILFMIVGVFAGLLRFTGKLKEDVSGISLYSLDLMKTSVEDIDEIDDRITKENRKDVFGMLFQGIIHLVTIPMLSEAIDRKVKLVGRMTKGMVNKGLMFLSDRIDFDEDNIDETIEGDDDEDDNTTKYIQKIENTKKRTERIIGKAIKVVRLPTRILFWISLIILILFIYFIW